MQKKSIYLITGGCGFIGSNFVEMLLKKGVCLSEQKLINFLRMLNVAIPQNSFDKIKSDFLFTINQERKLIHLTSNK